MPHTRDKPLVEIPTTAEWIGMARGYISDPPI